ncbi:MAG: DUF2190 family protein [Rubrivivax sp.]|nr:MAG: DUF2190 family protein [Rubrivivax sp.]
MKNFVQPGNTITLVAPYDVASGAGLLVGLIFGLATNAALSGADIETVLEGVFDVTALSTDVPAQGAALYWDNTNKRLTTTAGGNTKVGVAVKAKLNGELTARIRLNAAF